MVFLAVGFSFRERSFFRFFRLIIKTARRRRSLIISHPSVLVEYFSSLSSILRQSLPSVHAMTSSPAAGAASLAPSKYVSRSLSSLAPSMGASPAALPPPPPLGHSLAQCPVWPHLLHLSSVPGASTPPTTRRDSATPVPAAAAAASASSPLPPSGFSRAAFAELVAQPVELGGREARRPCHVTRVRGRRTGRRRRPCRCRSRKGSPSPSAPRRRTCCRCLGRRHPGRGS